MAPQLALQQAQQQRVPAPTVSLPHSHLQLQQARPSPPPPPTPQQHHHQLQLEAQSHQRAQRTPPAQHTKPAQTHEQAQSTARKRHQDQVDMHQKRAKQDNHHEYRPVKEEVVASTSEALPLLLPEDSFSYEGDDEFYAMFQNEPNEDEFTIKEDEFVKIDE